MELTQLQYLLTVANLGNVTRAASVLHISQSSLSKTIAKLEADIGIPLFDRTKNTIQINTAGRKFCARVEKAMRELEDGVMEMTQKDVGEIRLGITIPDFFSQFLLGFLKRYPEIRINHISIDPDQIITQLQQCEIDLALTFAEVITPDLIWTPLSNEEMVVLVSTKHPLAAKDCARLTEFKNSRFFSGSTSKSLRISFEQYCVKAGFVPQVVFEGYEPDLINQMVADNEAVTLVADRIYDFKAKYNPELFSRIKKVRIVEPSYIHHYGIVTLKEHYQLPCVTNLIAELLQEFSGERAEAPPAGSNAFPMKYTNTK